MRWDLFCRVIDNLGDIGVCWRLAATLAARGEAVRLWIDQPAPLAWMVAGGREGAARQGVEIRDWDPTAQAVDAEPGEVVVEAFGCDPHPGFLRAVAARHRPPAWFNLEYLSAEAYVARCHGLASPVLTGPAAGLSKRFFYPGFTADTGGLIREPDLAERQRAFDRDAWLASLGLRPMAPGERLASLFCYEPAALPALLRQLTAPGWRLLVTDGRARAAVEAALRPTAPAAGKASPRGAPAPLGLDWTPLPRLTQRDFDHLLWACDLNFVRGEDSLVRALWAGRPFVWQAYPQDDGAHHDKLAAFLDWLQPPENLRRAHLAWNAGGPTATASSTADSRSVLPAPAPPGEEAPAFLPIDLAAWGEAARAARARLLAGPELATSLLAAARAWPETR